MMMRAVFALVAASAAGCSSNSGAPLPPPSVASGVFLSLTVQGGGTVTSMPSGITCNGPTTCDNGIVAAQSGTTVTLTAAPQTGLRFVSWTAAPGMAQYEELVDASGAPAMGAADARCTASYPTQSLTGVDLTSPMLALPAGSVHIDATNVQCKLPGADSPAPARAIDVPLAYLLTGTFATP
jgi:hypothetical protein